MRASGSFCGYGGAARRFDDERTCECRKFAAIEGEEMGFNYRGIVMC